MQEKIKRPRLFWALLSATLLLVADTVIFPTLDAYWENPAEFEVGYLNMFAELAPVIALVMFLLLIPAVFSSRSILARYVSIILTLGVLSWLQGTMLLWDYGVFDGRETAWGDYDLLGWFDIALWFCLVALSIRFAGRLLPHVHTIAWILLLGQAAILSVQNKAEEGHWSKHQVAEITIPPALLQLSAQRNIFHLVLDSFQTDVFLQLVEEADLQDEFAGFTLFFENAGVAPHTSLAIPAVFSGQIYDGSESPPEYYKRSIADGFQNTLYDEGYTVNLVPQLSMRDARFSNYYQIPSTYMETGDELRHQNAMQLMDVALFKVSPHFLRRLLYDDGNWFLVRRFRSATAVTSFQEKAFLQDYINGMTVGSEKPAYHFIHLMPPHPPYVTLADGSYAGETLPNTRENFINESRALVQLLVAFMAKLKSLGVYDDALIILQGDHGSQINPVINGKEVEPCVSRLPALLAVKPAGKNQPMEISSAPSNLLDIRPTVLQFSGKETLSVFDLDATFPRKRPFVIFHGDGDTAQITNHTILGSVFSPQSCIDKEQSRVRVRKIDYIYGTEIVFGMTGDADPFLGEGWSAPLGRHRWTNGPRAIMRIPVTEYGRNLLMTARLRPFVNEQLLPVQRINVLVNGYHQTEWLAKQRKPREYDVLIPDHDVNSDELFVAFEFPDVASPKSLGVGGDQRLLGAALITLRLDIVNGLYEPQNYEQIPFYGRCRGCLQ